MKMGKLEGKERFVLFWYWTFISVEAFPFNSCFHFSFCRLKMKFTKGCSFTNGLKFVFLCFCHRWWKPSKLSCIVVVVFSRVQKKPTLKSSATAGNVSKKWIQRKIENLFLTTFELWWWLFHSLSLSNPPWNEVYCHFFMPTEKTCIVCCYFVFYFERFSAILYYCKCFLIESDSKLHCEFFQCFVFDKRSILTPHQVWSYFQYNNELKGFHQKI